MIWKYKVIKIYDDTAIDFRDSDYSWSHPKASEKGIVEKRGPSNHSIGRNWFFSVQSKVIHSVFYHVAYSHLLPSLLGSPMKYFPWKSILPQMLIFIWWVINNFDIWPFEAARFCRAGGIFSIHSGFKWILNSTFNVGGPSDRLCTTANVGTHTRIRLSTDYISSL